MSLAGTLGRASKLLALHALIQAEGLDKLGFLQLSIACRKMARVLDDEDRVPRRRARLRACDSSDDSDSDDLGSCLSGTSSSDSDGDSEAAQSPRDDNE